MQVLEIYRKYKNMPQQAEHQVTVAAIADFICEHLNVGVERENVVAACLLHDMGNIAKYNFDPETLALMPGLVDLATVPYWEEVKKEFLQKYGSGSHNMTMKIISEIGVSDRIKELVDCVGFSQGVENATSGDFGKKICAYSDMRVLPLGIGSLDDRLMDLRRRYKNDKKDMLERDQFENALRQIEKQIFEVCDIKAEDIRGEVILGRKEELKRFEI